MAALTVSISERSVVLGEHVIPGRWLRDHGDDIDSLNPDSKQRLTDTFGIDPQIAPAAVHVDGAWLSVDWSDGVRTGHDLGRLLAVASSRRSLWPRTGAGFTLPAGVDLWDSPAEATWFDFGVLSDDAAWTEALDHLRRFGWAAFDGAELGEESTMRLAERIGYPRASIFGTVWNMNSGSFEHQDSAYESFALDVHTDGTYSHDGPGTIVFAQQLKTGEGGDSVLVDGFAAARDFQAQNPEAADLLTRYAVTAHYVEPGVHLVA